MNIEHSKLDRYSWVFGKIILKGQVVNFQQITAVAMTSRKSKLTTSPCDMHILADLFDARGGWGSAPGQRTALPCCCGKTFRQSDPSLKDLKGFHSADSMMRLLGDG